MYLNEVEACWIVKKGKLAITTTWPLSCNIPFGWRKATRKEVEADYTLSTGRKDFENIPENPTFSGEVQIENFRGKESFFYTIVDETSGQEARLTFHVIPDKKEEKGYHLNLEFPPANSTMSQQQLAELGHLLIALSTHNYDLDACHELLAGYGEVAGSPLVAVIP